MFKVFPYTLSNKFDIPVKYSLERSGFLNYGLTVLWLDWLTHTSCHQIISQSVKSKHVKRGVTENTRKGRHIFKEKKKSDISLLVIAMQYYLA